MPMKANDPAINNPEGACFGLLLSFLLLLLLSSLN